MKNEPKEMISPRTRMQRGEHDRLGGQHRRPLGHREQGGPDHAGGVLGRDQQRRPARRSRAGPGPSPAPRMKFTGSAMIVALRVAARGPVQLATVSQVNSAVKPMVTTTKMISVQTVERTERIFVHSLSSSRPKPVARSAGGSGRERARPARRRSSGAPFGRGQLRRRCCLARCCPARGCPGRRAHGLRIQGCRRSFPGTLPPARPAGSVRARRRRLMRPARRSWVPPGR